MKPVSNEIESSSTNRIPQRVILLGAGHHRPELAVAARQLKPIIEQHFEVVWEDFDYTNPWEQPPEADLAIVLGGDGSILRAAKRMGYHQIPVLGVNLGKLGFLADIQPDQLDVAIEDIKQGNFRVIDHLMMRCQLLEHDQIVADELALNEAAFLGGPPFHIQQIKLFVDTEFATTYRCDGLILSTPIGSTAHNLSAGGPIVRKDLQAFVISAISPHTLTVRPVVDTADRIYEVVVTEPNESSCLVLDGRVIRSLTDAHRVRIQRADAIFQLIEIPEKGYYRTLREKLGWGGAINS